MVAVQVQAPARKPRAGGIKSVVGEFAREQRLGVGDVAWEDSGCGLPNTTRAGCYDDTFPLDYEPVEIDDGGVAYTFTRNADGTVDVSVTVGDGAAPEGFTAPWRPTDAVSETVGGGTAEIATDGAVTYTGTVSGTADFSYATTDRSGGTIPDKTFDGVNQHTAIAPAFAQYASVECYLGGDVDGSYEQQARDLLLAGEDRQVESVLWDWAVGDTPLSTVATLVAAMAAAEEAADASYVGQPVMVMSRAMATYASSQSLIERDGDVLRTVHGTPVLATGSVPDNEQNTIAVVGAIGVWATDVVATQVPYPTANLGSAIAERIYAVGVDCDYRYAVTATAILGGGA